MAESKLSPLPLDGTGKLKPFNDASISPSTSPNPPTADRDVADPVDAWVAENPNFDEPATPPVTETPATETPETEAPVTDPATEAPAETIAPEAKAPTTTEKPPEAAPVATAPAEATPPKPTYAPEEKMALAEGIEWTRAQVVAALQERTALQPQAAEADGYRKLFGMPLEQAQQAWGPTLQRLATEPNTVAFIDAYLANPEMAQYLDSCVKFYNQETGVPAPTPASGVATPLQQQRTSDDPLSREVAELRAWRSEQENRLATERVQREMAQVAQRYPFLATDRALVEDLMITGQALYAQDPSKGILDALALKAPLYDAVAIARSQQPAAYVPPQEQPAPQPALLGSPGASPNGSRPVQNGRPKSFDSLDDGVDDWITNPPKSFE